MEASKVQFACANPEKSEKANRIMNEIEEEKNEKLMFNISKANKLPASAMVRRQSRVEILFHVYVWIIVQFMYVFICRFRKTTQFHSSSTRLLSCARAFSTNSERLKKLKSEYCKNLKQQQKYIMYVACIVSNQD